MYRLLDQANLQGLSRRGCGSGMAFWQDECRHQAARQEELHEGGGHRWGCLVWTKFWSLEELRERSRNGLVMGSGAANKRFDQSWDISCNAIRIQKRVQWNAVQWKSEHIYLVAWTRTNLCPHRSENRCWIRIGRHANTLVQSDTASSMIAISLVATTSLTWHSIWAVEGSLQFIYLFYLWLW